MALYTYTGNKTAGDASSRVLFSTGKDIVLGETVDLTVGEVAEAAKAGDITLTAGTVFTNVYLFPVVQRFVRINGQLIAQKH